jgi:hypothetical protein
MNAENSARVTVDKWGEAVIRKGFQIVPDLLLQKQAVLGINEAGQVEGVSAPEMVVLLNVLMHWWTRESVPFPSAQLIADRIGVNRRSIDRTVEGLIRKKLLRKTRAGNLVMYDPAPLVERLQELAVTAGQREVF